MKLYLYDEITKEYIEAIEAYLDPEETKNQGKEVYMYPANSTDIEPPTTVENQVCIFEVDSWVVKVDFRGQYQCNENLEVSLVENIGDLQDGFILITEEQAKKIEEDKLFYIVQNGELVENPNYEAEQEQKEAERIQELYMTRSDFFDGTIQAWGVGQDELLILIQGLLATLPIEDVKKLMAINNFKNALNFYRKHDLFKMLVGMPIKLGDNIQLVIEDEHLDKFFDEVNKGNKETAWQYLPAPVMIPIEEDLQVEIEEELPAEKIVESEGNINEEIG